MKMESIGKNYMLDINKPMKTQPRNLLVVKKYSEESLFGIGVNIKEDVYQKSNQINKIRELLNDLKETDLLSNKNSFSPYMINEIKNEANVELNFMKNFYLEEGENIKIKVELNSLSKNKIVASDDIYTTKELNLGGDISINRVSLKIKEQDSLPDIEKKINFGEDLNKNKILEKEEDLDNNKELLTKEDMGIKASILNNKLYVESKENGENSFVSFEGSTSEIVEKLGLVDENGEIKNLIQNGEIGNVVINGKEYALENNKVELENLELDFSKSVEGKKAEFEISYSKEKIINKIVEFQEKYNEMVGFINSYVDENETSLKNIIYKLKLSDNPKIGLEIKTNKFNEDINKLKETMGNIVNENLEKSGLIKNDEGKLDIDLEKITNNLSDLGVEFEKAGINELRDNLEKYFEKVNILDIKKEIIPKEVTKQNIEKIQMNEYSILINENKNEVQFLKNSLKLMEELELNFQKRETENEEERNLEKNRKLW
ncbi:MAG: hypothetical protein B6I28_05490 [Fusobacteriia bacterium 4572_132]|nr:MAG: hypothetical protein B6I28_05490 [Fusobacteriia bacterium 4572_132]